MCWPWRPHASQPPLPLSYTAAAQPQVPYAFFGRYDNAFASTALARNSSSDDETIPTTNDRLQIETRSNRLRHAAASILRGSMWNAYFSVTVRASSLVDCRPAASCTVYRDADTNTAPPGKTTPSSACSPPPSPTVTFATQLVLGHLGKKKVNPNVQIVIRDCDLCEATKLAKPWTIDYSIVQIVDSF